MKTSARPISANQLSHLERALSAIQSCRQAQALADEVAAAGWQGLDVARQILASDPSRMLHAKISSCSHNLRNAYRCAQNICPRCRNEHIRKRLRSALPAFNAHPRDDVYWGTLLVSAERQLFEPKIVPNILDPLGARLPTRGEVASKLLEHIRLVRAQVDNALRSLKPVTYIAEGAFELSVIEPATCGAQKARFLQDLGYATGSAAEPGLDLVLPHLHFLMLLRSTTGYANGSEITTALTRTFPHRHQVLVMPMDKRKVLSSNIVRLASYASKTHTDFRPERVTEIARVLEAVGRQGLLYARRQGTGLKSSAIPSSHRPSPRPSRTKP